LDIKKINALDKSNIFWNLTHNLKITSNKENIWDNNDTRGNIKDLVILYDNFITPSNVLKYLEEIGKLND